MGSATRWGTVGFGARDGAGKGECVDFGDRVYGCLLGGLIGDAMGSPTEGMEPEAIESRLGWVEDFEGDGTDDSLLKYLLCDALLESEGYATSDEWAAVWVARRAEITGPKRGKFFISVQHTFRKLLVGYIPRAVSTGNLPSSSSAMSISPVGIVNAGHPRMAAAQAQELGSLIHTGDVSFCQDGAAAIAAAVAEALSRTSSLTSLLEAGTSYLKPQSGLEVRELIERALELARQEGEYRAFRAAYHETFRRRVGCDTRETVPAVFGLCYLADGNPREAITYSANFGRDTDTIATMAGAICGALRGAAAIPGEWVRKAEEVSARDQRELAGALIGVAGRKARQETSAWRTLLVQTGEA